MKSLINHFGIHPYWSLAFALAIALGAVLRLIWGMDIEFKGDEHWMFVKTQTLGTTESFSWFGMTSSSVFLNPGMNVWVFWGIGQLLGADTPPELARGVQLLSILAMVLCTWFVWRCVPEGEREMWWWGLALMALSPITVLFHRKIWQPCLFPMFTLVWLIGWWRRDRAWGAFLWGLLGAVLGQIQLAGLFFAAGCTAWALCFDRRRVRWGWWLAGSVVGVLPMIPWLLYMLNRPPGDEIRGAVFSHLVDGRFWQRWLMEAFGVSAQYALGQDFGDFLRYPLISGVPTYGMLLLHIALGILVAVILGRGAMRIWERRRHWPRMFVDRDSPTAFTIQAVLWGFGLCMTCTLMPFHRHYMLIAMPLVYVWVTRWTLQSQRPAVARTLLLGLCATHALISLQMMGYIHVNGPTIRGQIGIPYGAQLGQEGSDASNLARAFPHVASEQE